MADVAELGFKVDSSDVAVATTELDKLSDAAKRTETATQQMQGHIDRVGRGLRSFGDGAIAVGGALSKSVTGPLLAAVTAVGAFGVSFARTADEVAKTAREAGLSGQAFQELGFAIGQVSQVSEGEARRALQQLNATIGEGVRGNEKAVESLLGLGFSMEEIASGAIGSEAAFTRLVEHLGQTGTAAEAAAIASDLLGARVGRALGPALRESSDAVGELRQQFRDLGLGISQDGLDAAEQFNDQIDVLQRQLGAAGAAIGTALLPALIELAPVLQDRILPAIISVAEGLAGLIRWFSDLPGPVQEAVGIVAALLGAGGPILLAIGALSKALGALVLATGPIGLFIAAAVAAYTAWQVWGDDIKALVESVSAWLSEKFTWLKDRLISIIASIGDAIVEAFSRPFNRITDLTESVTGKIVSLWEKAGDILVWNSVIPDFNRAIEDDFARSHDVIVGQVQATVDELEAVYSRLAQVQSQLMPQTEEEAKQARFDEQMAVLREALELEAITRAEYREYERMAIEEFDTWREEQRQGVIEREMADMQRVADEESRLMQQRLSGWSGFFGNLATITAAGGKRTFALFKAFAVAQAVIDAISAAQGAYKVGASIGGPPLGAAFAAAAMGAQMARLAQIKATDYTGTSASNAGTRGGSVGAAAAPVAPAAPAPRDVTVRLEGGRTIFGREDLAQILEGLNDLTGDGARYRLA